MCISSLVFHRSLMHSGGPKSLCSRPFNDEFKRYGAARACGKSRYLELHCRGATKIELICRDKGITRCNSQFAMCNRVMERHEASKVTAKVQLVSSAIASVASIRSWRQTGISSREACSLSLSLSLFLSSRYYRVIGRNYDEEA